MQRYFEKISFKQFKKDVMDSEELYNSYKIPTRATKRSAGYDFKVLNDIHLDSNEYITIPTGVKVSMNEDEVFQIFIRSSLGFKYNIRLVNQVGIIDSDYYNNDNNEGHIWIRIKNEGTEKLELKKGNSFAQGVFYKFLVVENEEKIENERTGGIGSTDKEG